MNRWIPVVVLSALWIWVVSPSAQAENSLKAALAQQLGTNENVFAKLSDDQEVSEMDVPDRSRQVSLVGLVRLSSSGETLLQDLAEGRNGSLLGPSQEEGFFGRPATPEDLARLVLPDGDFEVLAECKPNNCKFKLNREGIEKAQSIDWKKRASRNQFSEYFRDELARYVNEFRQEGSKALVVYDDKPKPFALKDGAQSLRALMTLWSEREPRLFTYLEQYPSNPPEGIQDQIYWSLKDFGYRPTLSVDLVVVDSAPQTPGIRAIFVQQTIYADHYLAARYQLGALLDGPEALGVPGQFLFLSDQMLFDDGLGSFKRSMLGRGMKGDLADRLESIAKMTEKK